ncbi:Uncharacterized protein conserved in bacteria [Chlamydia abortus]|uniref:UPF0340 protein ACFQ03_22330 n=1 Tax=Paenibacillus residui TaxID=629724 RepID=A0ABW3DH34_9BACL|nr:Uncharacterized protein conserved in bacteria [Chlamydia abortus]
MADSRSDDYPVNESLLKITEDVNLILRELLEAGHIQDGQLVVVGTSTSEVMGRRIGSAGAMGVAERIFEGVMKAREKVRFYPVFQCCEHLNRALVLEKEALASYPSLEPVSVIPVPKAGGSMAAYAYNHLNEPVVVETVQAHAGIDIGDTLIGMHLRKVAVPVRPSIRSVGQAHVVMAYTRPKLIGGARAVYTKQEPSNEGACL